MYDPPPRRTPDELEGSHIFGWKSIRMSMKLTSMSKTIHEKWTSRAKNIPRPILCLSSSSTSRMNQNPRKTNSQTPSVLMPDDHLCTEKEARSLSKRGYILLSQLKDQAQRIVMTLASCKANTSWIAGRRTLEGRQNEKMKIRLIFPQQL